MHLSREHAEALGIDFDAGRLRADLPPPAPPDPARDPPRVRVLVLVGHTPPTLNQLTRGTIRDRIRLGKRWRAVVREHAAGMTPATGRVRVSLVVLLPRGRQAPDPDSLLKATGDALVAARLLRDDDEAGVEWSPVRFVRDCDYPATVILLRNLDG